MSQLQFVYVTYILSTPEKVWTALTDAELTAKYWFLLVQLSSHVNVLRPLTGEQERYRHG